MKVIYIAEDGKKFDDEYECEEYERSLKMANLPPLTMFDHEGEPTDQPDAAWFVKIDTEEEADAAHFWNEETGANIPEETGIYFYNEYNNYWCNFALELERAKVFVAVGKQIGL